MNLNRCMCLLYCIVIEILFKSVRSFNIDTQYPLSFSGPSSSYFGYSVSLLINSKGSWLVVGAPRANSTYEEHRDIFEPGVIFRCEVQTQTCTSLVLDKQGNGEPVIITSDLKYRELKDQMWLGVSVDTTTEEDGRLVACAHRWRNQYYRGHHLMNGVCYTINRELDDQSRQKLLPLLSGSQQILKTEEYKYAVGQAGMSAHFIKDSDSLLLGAPGINDWKGSVAVLSRAESGIISKRSTLQSYANRMVPNPLNMIDYGSYLGYAVTSGKFHENGAIRYVIGAPRNNYKGTVFIVNIVEDRLEGRFESKIEKHGEQMGEYFGASVLAVDLTNDGLDDLLVGAPFHSREGDEGKVYVYVNKGSSRLLLANDGLVGTNTKGSRFGTSMAILGDVNMDGYQDVVIGAPYENDRGAVYIYHGTPNGLKTQFQQRIDAKQASGTTTGFGISLSRGIDIDANNYPDLAVGAYQTNEAFIFRSRPLVYLKGSLSPDQSQINMDRKDCNFKGTPATCFQLNACVSYTGKFIPPTLAVRIVLEMDVLKANQTNSTRARIRTPTDQKLPFIQLEEILNSGQTWCKKYEIHVLGQPWDITTPIQMQLRYEIISGLQREKKFCPTCPMIDKSQPNQALSQVRFQKNCGDDDRCDSDLHLNALIKDYSPGDAIVIGSTNKLVLQLDVSNTKEPAYATMLFVDIPSWMDIDQRPPACEFTLENRHRLNCMIANPLKTNAKVSLNLNLNLQRIPVKNGEMFLNVSTMTDSYEDESQKFDNHASITIPVSVVADVFTLGVTLNEQIFYDHDAEGKVKETEMANFSHVYEVFNIGPSPVHLVTVQLQFPSRSLDGRTHFMDIIGLDKKDGSRGAVFGTCEGEFGKGSRPTAVTSETEGVTLLPIDDAIQNTTVPPMRKRREVERLREGTTETVISNETETTKLHEESMKVDCSTTMCETITCTVGPFEKGSSVQITMHASIRVYYLKNLMRKKETANIFTSARVFINSTTDVQPREHKSDIAIVSSELKPGGPPLPKALAGWIIPVSIIGGLLLLVLITTAMVKMGFFRRQKKEEMERMLHGEQNSSLMNTSGGNTTN